jgi:hypothetical protein
MGALRVVFIGVFMAIGVVVVPTGPLKVTEPVPARVSVALVEAVTGWLNTTGPLQVRVTSPASCIAVLYTEAAAPVERGAGV